MFRPSAASDGAKESIDHAPKKCFFMVRNALPHKKNSHRPPHESDLRQQQKLLTVVNVQNQQTK